MESRIYSDCSETMAAFHRHDGQFRCIVGAVGSGKTTAALWEICFFLPRHMALTYNIQHTKFAVVRKTYERLMDTDWYEINHWFPNNVWHAQRRIMEIHFPKSKGCPYPLFVELYFRSLDQDDSMDKLRSLNLTGAWVDEAWEVKQGPKELLITRLGRWPRTFTDHNGVDHMGSPVRYMVETSNPMPVNHIMYYKYKWLGTKIDPKTGELEIRRPPGPVPKQKPAKGFVGWWQVPGENEKNLRPGYYEDLKASFPESPEMVAMLVSGKPGYKPEGKGVYRNYDIENRSHEANAPIIWKQDTNQYTGEMSGVPLYAGWDNNGHNNLACIVGQVVGPFKLQILREYTDERMNIIDYTNWVLQDLEQNFPGFTCTHYCDPAAFSKYSAKEGGLTSNAQLAQQMCGIKLIPSVQALDVRINCVDQMLKMRDGLLIDPSCTGLINGFHGGYVYEENPRMGISAFKEDPKKNPFSHIHDALQYLVVPVFFPAMIAAVKTTVEDRLMRDLQGGYRAPWETARDVTPGAVRAFGGYGESQPVVEFDSRFPDGR